MPYTGSASPLSHLDMARLRSRLAPTAGPRIYLATHDLNGDGRVSALDILVLRRHLFACTAIG